MNKLSRFLPQGTLGVVKSIALNLEGLVLLLPLSI